MKKAKIRLTPFQAYIADGSDISNPDVDSGYQHELALELKRIGPGGGMIELDKQGLLDLAEFANALSGAVAQEPNPSGARSLATLHRRAHDLAQTLDV